MSEALNVTKAAFGGLREVTTAPLWQYDYGQILQITGLDLPQAFEVHFSNSRKSGETITQIGTDGQVTIPDMYLTSGADIYAFVFLHDGLTDGETEYVIKIPVRERPEPSDIEPTPEQQDAITEAIAALNDAVTQTGEDKEATAALAEAAAASSLVATEAAQSAQGSATSASASATTASTAAATATQKASEAAQSASEAESARASARNYAASASDSAGDADEAKTAAQSAAQTATAKASEASTSATNASGSASAASASASQASESATSAANSATAASGSATSAATSATTASTKASEASASATAAQTAQTAAEAAQSAAETAQTEAEAARDETVTEAASIRGLLKDKADIIISNADGAIATFNDGGNNMPMVSCVAKIESVQSGSGDPSPENVRPISGWTGCSVVVSPTENAQDGTTYPISWQSEAGTVYGGTVDLVSGVLTVTAIGKVFDGTEDWASYQTSPNRFYRYTLTNIQTSSPTNENRACSHFRNAAVITSTTSVGFNGYTSSGMNSIWFNFRPDLEEIPDVDAWKAWLAEQYANGTPVQAYCPIITPITYQLTPTEVRTLLGLNNVWADTGDVEAQYRADTKLYIDGKNTDFSKLIAPTEAAYTATRAYTTGSLLIVGSQLYKATASIANGATLTVRTNITATTLAEVIAAL